MMRRRLLLFGFFVALAAARAPAMEMETNFHNGENVGFPPLEVPMAIYGHGGWNCAAMGHVPMPSGMPAQMPTGCSRGNSARWRGANGRMSRGVYFPPNVSQQTSNGMKHQSQPVAVLKPSLSEEGQESAVTSDEINRDEPSASTSPKLSSRNGKVWPQAEALFPHSDGDRDLPEAR